MSPSSVSPPAPSPTPPAPPNQTPLPPIIGPYSHSLNFSYDIQGTQDTRPGTWGDTGVETITDLFHPPPGYLVRVLRVYGDFIAWPHPPAAWRASNLPTFRFAGVLWGLTNSTPGGNPQQDLSAAGCFLYLQQGVGAYAPARAAFDHNVSAGGLLNLDNTMLSKVAVFLNELYCPIHVEVTFVCEFQFELVGLGGF